MQRALAAANGYNILYHSIHFKVSLKKRGLAHILFVFTTLLYHVFYQAAKDY